MSLSVPPSRTCPPDARGVAEGEKVRQGGRVIWGDGGGRLRRALEADLMARQQPGFPAGGRRDAAALGSCLEGVSVRYVPGSTSTPA
jgi:hypothetical protein